MGSKLDNGGTWEEATSTNKDTITPIRVEGENVGILVAKTSLALI